VISNKVDPVASYPVDAEVSHVLPFPDALSSPDVADGCGVMGIITGHVFPGEGVFG